MGDLTFMFKDGPDSKDLLEIERAVLTAFLNEFEQLQKRFMALDSKAQGTASTSGIFLAAIFAFIRSNAQVPTLAVTLVVCALLLFVTAIALAVYAMRVRRVMLPPKGEDVMVIGDRLVKGTSKDSSRSPLLGFYNLQAHEWRVTVDSLEIETRKKALQVEGAQWVLFLGIALIAVTASLDLLY